MSKTGNDTRATIMETAEHLIRTRGYPAFSYADLAAKANITKASVHYHFATKEDLLTVLVDDCYLRTGQVLDNLDRQHPNPARRLRAYGEGFLLYFHEGKMPVCCALVVDLMAVPTSVHPKITGMLEMQIAWLARVLKEGIACGEIVPHIDPVPMANALMSTLEGGIVVAWGTKRPDPVLTGFNIMMRSIETSQPT